MLRLRLPFNLVVQEQLKLVQQLAVVQEQLKLVQQLAQILKHRKLVFPHLLVGLKYQEVYP